MSRFCKQISLVSERWSLRLRSAFILLFILFLNIQSQNNITDKPLFYSLSSYYGFFQVHTDKLSPYKGVNPICLEFEVSQLLMNEQVLNALGFYSKWGVGLNYVDFGHDDLGYSVHGVAYFEPLLWVRSRWWFSGKIGMGIAFVSEKYHPETNPQNKTNSTHLAFPLAGSISSYYILNEQWRIKASFSFRHISNGGLKQPNLGINYPVAGLGVEYTANRYEIQSLDNLDPFEKKKRQELLLGYSAKSDTVSSTSKQVIQVCYNRSFRGGRINSFTLAGLVEYQQSNDAKSSIDQWSVAPLVGNEFIFGKVRFGQQLGIYLLKGVYAGNNLFQQYYLRYLLGEHLTTGFNLKAHGRVADHLSVQIGYVF
ncbi:acyloxyacyl hydrolase [Labilibacter sediminis]|nr:acyloxyacyl hydrolase [Labilibacter sediminis]